MSTIGLSGIPNVGLPGAAGLENAGGIGDTSFTDVLKNAVNTVNALHDNAASQVGNLLSGTGGDVNDVMIAVEKADVSFQLMMQVRNKIVSAYQDIEKMQF